MAETITAVVPLYNKAPWVKDSIQSILSQSRQVNEVIIVDDGSTDDGPKIVRSLGGEQVRLLRTARPRSGPSAARNIGIRAATSEWIALLDADDQWSPGYMLKMLNAIEANPDIGCVFSSRCIQEGSSVRQDPAGRAGGGARRLTLSSYLELWNRTGVKGSSVMCSSASVIRKSVLEAAGLFPEAYRQGEDKDTWLRVMAITTALYLPEPLITIQRNLPLQLTGMRACSTPPVALTAAKMARSGRFSAEVSARLQILANREIWLYAKRARLRRLDPEALKTFHALTNPLLFTAFLALYYGGRIEDRDA